MKNLSLLSLALLPLFSFAHDPLDEQFTVFGRQLNLIGEASTASSGEVSQTEIEVRPLSRTGEILELVPGMVVTQHSGSGKSNQFFLRGFNLDHGTDFASSIDGMPLNMPTHGHGQGYTDLNFVIPEAISKLEYQKGSYYADVGDFSGAGSVRLSSVSKTSRGVTSVTIGENEYVRGVFMNSFETYSGQTLLAVEGNQYAGPWDDVDEDVEKTNIWLKHSRKAVDGLLSVSLMGYKNSWNSADQIPRRAFEQGLITRLGSLDTSLGGESERYSFNLSWSNDDIEANMYAISYQLNLWSNFTYFLDEPALGDQFEQVDDRTIYGGNVRHISDMNWFSLIGTNTFGMQFRVDDIDEVGLFKSQQRSRIGAVRLDEVRQSSIGLFWENELELTSQLRSLLGVRYDYYDFDVQDIAGVNLNGVDLASNSGTNNDDIVSVKGSLIYEINDEWEGYASAGQGFHSNDARGTTIEVDPADGQLVDAVDPLVRSLGYEVGLRGFILETLNTSMSLWSLELDSELLFVGDAGNTEASGKSKRRGFEVTGYYSFKQDWTFDLEYAYTDAKLKDAPRGEDHIPGAIKHVVQLGVSLNQPQGWFGSLRYRYFGERALTEDASVKSGNSGLWNLRAGYRFDDINVSLEVLNLTDSKDNDIEYFYSSRLVNEPVEGIDDVHLHPFEPRNIRLTVQYQF